MENHKYINHELAIQNQELKTKNVKLEKEIIYLNQIINQQKEELIEQKNENIKIKEIIKKILANSYAKILKEVCGMPDLSKINSTISEFIPSVVNSSSNGEIITRVYRTRATLNENSKTENFELENISSTMESHNNSSQSSTINVSDSLNISLENENSENHTQKIFYKTPANTNDVSDMISENLKKEKRQSGLLETIAEESSNVTPYYKTRLSKSKGNSTLTQLNIPIKKDNLFIESNEISLVIAQDTFSDTTMNLLKALSSTPFKKRKYFYNPKTKRLNPVVKIRRLKKFDFLQFKLKECSKPNKNNIQQIQKINFIKTEKEDIETDESSNDSKISPRSRRRIAGTINKEAPINSKLRYDRKKLIKN